ncbi:hypothetical protein HMPREF0281_02123 [Corynebacterium ammoniagenes DSM 20306]|uniref:Uncharacterized protein n=1 Tax=Corynebacterium ammoniagenes DSM 20306 TaxID=649754 RepID=A0ABP2IB59_CORAM|nr:hypothetical protein HMPREF0281_02123 [Corynebacterium ammoniagenes DSM 20306]
MLPTISFPSSEAITQLPFTASNCELTNLQNMNSFTLANKKRRYAH